MSPWPSGNFLEDDGAVGRQGGSLDEKRGAGRAETATALRTGGGSFPAAGNTRFRPRVASFSCSPPRASAALSPLSTSEEPLLRTSPSSLSSSSWLPASGADRCDSFRALSGSAAPSEPETETGDTSAVSPFPCSLPSSGDILLRRDGGKRRNGRAGRRGGK
ncbi:hypothetical protein TGMAS_417140 [Toxoplasma gondii MAS]|uniref:Uncharacterized protein n=1 Tax=Toxoplasma gondii MAS TaxID=943118 RepID=A0A086PLE3_TOXGO|nr:hypothetical protein TGMAS_417140 [Toxoplasma gondii MAS]